MKTCKDCGQTLPLSEFYTHHKGKSSYPYPRCKKCHIKRTSARIKLVKPKNNHTNREGERLYRMTAVAKKYGMTLEEYRAAMLLPCAICEKPSAAMDHSHETGTVREPLCRSCNLMLGHAKDDPQLLRAAADYLERHQHQV